MNCKRAVEGFLLSLSAEGYSQQTIDLYNWGLTILANYFNDSPIEDITPDDMQHFYLWVRTEYKTQADKPLAPASIENIWIAIRSFYNWVETELGIQRADGKLKRPKYKSPVISPLSEDDIRKLLIAANSKTHKNKRRDKAIILVLLDTGLRVSELARIKVDALDLEKGIITIQPHGTGNKTEPRQVYIGKAARTAVWIYLNQREPLFPTDPLFMTSSRRQMDRNNIRHMLKRLAKSAGVNDVYPHKFRHTFAIQFLRNGGDVFTLQRILGHSTLDMVRQYLSIAEADAENVHRTASPVDRWRL